MKSKINRKIDGDERKTFLMCTRNNLWMKGL